MKKPFLAIFFSLILLVVLLTSACNETTISFSIEFIVDENAYDTVSTSGNTSIKMPLDPSKDGYIFAGWFWDKDTWTRPFTANSLLEIPLSSNMNVYAKWDRAENYCEVYGHFFVAYISDNNATCIANGTKTAQCENCSATDTIIEEGTALGHSIINHAASEPSCLDIGWPAYETCSRCNYTTYEELPALGHIYSSSNITNPTCTTKGFTTHICSRCNDSYMDEFTNEIGHDIISNDAKVPSCTEIGWNAYETCSM